MTFHVANGNGESIDAPSNEQMRRFLEDVDASDAEHGAAWLATDDDHCLEWSGDGRLLFDRADAPIRHLPAVSRERALGLWIALAGSRLDEVEREPWQPGNGYVRTREQEEHLRAVQHQQARVFYDALGPERANVACRRPGCSRGAISLGVLCRPHHFEMIRGGRCPFSD